MAPGLEGEGADSRAKGARRKELRNKRTRIPLLHPPSAHRLPSPPPIVRGASPPIPATRCAAAPPLHLRATALALTFARPVAAPPPPRGRGAPPLSRERDLVLGASAIPSWRTLGFVEYIPSGKKQGGMVLVVPEGSYAVRLGNEASIRQRLAGAARGARYALTFSAARTCAQAERLNVSASGQWAVLPMQTMYSSNGWDSYAWTWDAAANVFDVVIHNPGVTEDPACGSLIRNTVENSSQIVIYKMWRQWLTENSNSV
ncbi:hypothetical protein OsI_07475 [Oryza sativa Indica Group]|uniref:DUF642 domain-containing protein n=1 Tax=Oryza sativa subsp. indica TaxID=39946 RepID=B8AJ28_ORYSI|nr:hypothetical protein OsI_07475 [Oryza sativa Indica Group]